MIPAARVLVSLLLASAACRGTPSPDKTVRYPLTGTVVSVDRARTQLVVAHDAIERFMPAMTMPFAVAGTFPAVQPGDHVKGTIVLRDDTTRLEEIVVTKRASGPILTSSPALPGPPIGAEVPDFKLRNQDDRPIHIHEFRGRVLLLTFIYTRCPLPDFCPLMMKHFAAVERSLASRPDLSPLVHLLGVSIDPDYDTPEVLRAYGKGFLAGPSPFARLDLATGAPAEIHGMTTYFGFGLAYSKDAALITHGLSTAIIGADGRIVALLPSNAWRPEEALDALDTYLRQHRR